MCCLQIKIYDEKSKRIALQRRRWIFFLFSVVFWLHKGRKTPTRHRAIHSLTITRKSVVGTCRKTFTTIFMHRQINDQTQHNVRAFYCSSATLLFLNERPRQSFQTVVILLRFFSSFFLFFSCIFLVILFVLTVSCWDGRFTKHINLDPLLCLFCY